MNKTLTLNKTTKTKKPPSNPADFWAFREVDEKELHRRKVINRAAKDHEMQLRKMCKKGWNTHMIEEDEDPMMQNLIGALQNITIQSRQKMATFEHQQVTKIICLAELKRKHGPRLSKTERKANAGGLTRQKIDTIKTGIRRYVYSTSEELQAQGIYAEGIFLG